MTSAMTFGCLSLRKNRPKSCVIKRITPISRQPGVNHDAFESE